MLNFIKTMVVVSVLSLGAAPAIHAQEPIKLEFGRGIR